MKNAIVCPRCKHENMEDGSYCSNCGFLLKDDMDSKLKFYETKIEAAAEHAETETYERIIKWAKQSTWAIGIALTILGVTASVGAYLGIGTINDFNNKFKGYEEDVSKTMARIDNANKKIDEQLKIIAKQKDKFNEIERQQADIQNKIDEYNGLFNKLMKTANQFYNLNLQISDDVSDADEIIQRISERLTHNGFIVDPVKILRVRVDTTEVIYYSKYSEQKAEEVANEVKSALNIKHLKLRFIKSLDANRYVILIKISK